MRKPLRKGLVASAVVAAGIGLTAVPAYAGPPFTVSGSPGAVTAESDNTFLQLVRNGTVVDTLRCDISTVDATIRNATYNTAPADVGDIIDSTWDGCRDDNFGLTFGVDQVGTWNLNVVADGPPGDVVGSVSDVVANISGPGCTATFVGTAPGFYTNATHTLTLDPDVPGVTNTLHVSTASCLGIIQPGDVARFNGEYLVDPPTVEING